MNTHYKVCLIIFSFIFNVQTKAELNNPEPRSEAPYFNEDNLLTGFTIRPGIGTAFVDVAVIRKSDQYEAVMTDSRDSLGSPFMTLSIITPTYYFNETPYISKMGYRGISRWGVGLRSETHTFSLSHQSLAQNENFKPEDIGTSVSGFMSYLSLMLYKELNSRINYSDLRVIFGVGYTKGFAELDGTAIFGPDRNTTGITQVDNISTNTSKTTGLTLLVEMEVVKLTIGLELAFVDYQNDLYSYEMSGAKFYLSYPFAF